MKKYKEIKKKINYIITMNEWTISDLFKNDGLIDFYEIIYWEFELNNFDNQVKFIKDNDISEWVISEEMQPQIHDNFSLMDFMNLTINDFIIYILEKMKFEEEQKNGK